MIRYLMGLIICMLLVGGCLNTMKTSAKVAAVEKNTTNEAKEEVQMSGGRDVLNVSPTVAVSGGGGVLLAGLMMLLGGWLRTRRTLRTVVQAIETLEGSGEAKTQIAKAALQTGVADYLHEKVQQWSGKKGEKKDEH